MQDRDTIWRQAAESLLRLEPFPEGTVCVLRGPAGAGESHFLQQLARQLPESVLPLVAEAPEGGPGIPPPLLPITAAFRQAVRSLPERAAGRRSDIPLPEIRENVFPLTIAEETRRAAPGSPSERIPSEAQVFVLLERLLRHLGQHGRPVLLCADVQRYDASSTAFLATLIRHFDRYPLFLLLCFREDGDHPWEDERLREALDGLPPERLQRLTLDPLMPEMPEEVAEIRREPLGTNRDAELWGEAGEEALRRGASSAAERMARQQDAILAAAGVPAEVPSRLAAVELWARALVLAGHRKEAAEILRPLTTAALDTGAARLLYTLGMAESGLPSVEERRRAIGWFERARDLCRGPAEDGRASGLVARIWLDLAFAHNGFGEYDSAARAYRRAIQHSRLDGDPAMNVRLMRLASLFYPPRRVVREITRALEEARRHGAEQEEAFCLNDRGTALLTLQGFEQARADFQRGCQILERRGAAWTGVPLNNLGVLELLSDQKEEAHSLFCEATSRAGDPELLWAIRGNQAILRALRGDVTGAAADFGTLAGEADQTGDLFLRSRLHHNRARALLFSGHPEEAWKEVVASPLDRHVVNDELLEGRRARLLLDILAALNSPLQEAADTEKLLAQARGLDGSIQPQAWFFRRGWAFLEVGFR